MTIQKILSKTKESLLPTTWVDDVNDQYVRQACQDLLDTLANYQHEIDKLFPGKGIGVGLAANQIEYPYQPISDRDPAPKTNFYPLNFLPPRIYVISIRQERAQNEQCPVVAPIIYINASYTPFSEEDDPISQQVFYEEGCLSINGIKGFSVPRYDKILLSTWDHKGEKLNLLAQGFIARVHQHEIDHGEGKEYLNHMSFNQTELIQISNWIKKYRLTMLSTIPTWIIPGKLQCMAPNPDFSALLVWVENEFKKQDAK